MSRGGRDSTGLHASLNAFCGPVAAAGSDASVCTCAGSSATAAVADACRLDVVLDIRCRHEEHTVSRERTVLCQPCHRRREVLSTIPLLDASRLAPF